MAMSIEAEMPRTPARGSIPLDSFGNRLMLARAHAGHISIREAADLCDIGRGAWTNWEKGARPVDIIEVAAVIAEKLDVDKDWLLFGGDLAKGEPRRRLSRRRENVSELYRYPTDRVAVSPLPGSGRPKGRRDSTRPARTVRLPRTAAS